MTKAKAGPDSAPDQVARLLALVPFLHARGEVRLEDAAQHFGITPAQLDKDLRLLFMTGLPGGMPDDLIEVDIEALEGDGVIRVSNADYLTRPVRFSPAEATALVVALRTMVDAASRPEVVDVLTRALGKLEAVAQGGATSMHVQAGRPASPARDVVAGSLTEGRRVRLDYLAAGSDQMTTRVVSPRAIARVDGVEYLDAWCHEVQGERAFRLDRINSAQMLDEAIGDEAGRPRDLTRDWFKDQETVEVTLSLSPEAHWIAEYHPVTHSTPRPDGSLEVVMDIARPEWLHQLLLRVSPHASVLAPDDVRSDFIARVSAAAELYAGAGVD